MIDQPHRSEYSQQDRQDSGLGWPDQASYPGTGRGRAPRPRRAEPTADHAEPAPATDRPRRGHPHDPHEGAAGGGRSRAGQHEPAEERVPDTTAESGKDDGEDGESNVPSARRRFSVANVITALLVGLLGFGLVVQLKSHSTDPTLATARPEDLVRILSDLDAREQRLRQEIASLEETQRQLASGAQGRQAALEEARKRANELGILAGTLPAEGPGLTVTFGQGSRPLKAQQLLDAVEELRGAGAEAMQISGASGAAVRIVASTAFVDANDGVLVGGKLLTAPYTLVVIGDPQTMRTALNIPGGVVETVAKDGGTVTIGEPALVRVTALHMQQPLKYAQPD